MDYDLLKKVTLLLLMVALALYIGFFIGVYYGNTEHKELVEKMNYKLSDRIAEDDIVVFDDKIIIWGDFEWARFLGTDSMLPLLDEGSTGIELELMNTTQLRVGDIISFEVRDERVCMPTETEKCVYIHRIVDIKYDDDGIYYQTKGDNSPCKDPLKVRRDQILRVLVGILW